MIVETASERRRRLGDGRFGTDQLLVQNRVFPGDSVFLFLLVDGEGRSLLRLDVRIDDGVAMRRTSDEPIDVQIGRRGTSSSSSSSSSSAAAAVDAQNLF